jgi:excisionase family DNA binding protein
MFDFLSALEQSTSLLTADQVQAMLKVSKRTMARYIASREIPSVLIGTQRRFDPKVLYWWYTKRYPEVLKARQAA